VNEDDEKDKYGALEVNVDAGLSEMYYKEYYKPIWNQFGNATKTLTGRGAFFDNNINFVKLPADEVIGYRFEIAVSANNSGKDPGVGIWATFDGTKLIFESDKPGFNVTDVKSDYSVLLYSKMPSQNEVNKANKHGNKVYDFTTGGGDVYFIFHNAGGLKITTDEQIGWAFDRKEGPFIRPYRGNVEVIKTITNMDGEVMDDLSKLKAGEYLVSIKVIYDGGEITNAAYPIVVADEKTIVDFGPYTIDLGAIEKVYPWFW
jgi:hypothetical protein